MICPWAHPNIGGVESHIEKLMQALVPRGYTITLVTYQPLTSNVRGEPIEHRPGITIHRFPWFGQGWFPRLEQKPFPIVFLWLFPGLFAGALKIFLKERKIIDVIHAHGFIAAAVAKILSFLKPVRVVVSTHAMYQFPQRRSLRTLVRWLLSSANSIMCVGSPSRRELIHIGIQEDKIKILRNWVDLDFFYPHDRDQCRADLHIQGFTVLYVGRLIAKKGIPVLLDAARALPHVQFVFVGDGPEAKNLEVAQRDLLNVDFRGKIDGRDLPKYYSAADVFAQLATYEEGQAAVFLEAIACGTPVIASESGCARDYLQDSVAILTTPTTQSLVTVLKSVLSRSDALGEMRKACVAYAQQYFSDENIDVFLEAYSS